MLDRISNLGNRAQGVSCSLVGFGILWPDNGNVNYNSSNANFPNVGGNYNNDDNCGIFYCNVNNNSTNSNSNYRARLTYLTRLMSGAFISHIPPLFRGWTVSVASSLGEILGLPIYSALVPSERSEGRSVDKDTRGRSTSVKG